MYRGTVPQSVRRSLALTLVLIWISQMAAQPKSETVAITGVTVVEVESGELLSDRTVIVNGDRIGAVSPDRQLNVPTGARVLNARGKFLIPGLWDMHVHTLPQSTRPRALETFLPLFVVNGVTGVREMGAERGILKVAREQMARSPVPVPRVVASGSVLDGYPPLNPAISIAVDTAEDASRAVDTLRTAGAEFVKVHSGLSRDAYFAVVEAARQQGLPVTGHVPAQISAAEASDAGQRSIEHLAEISMGCSSEETALRRDLIAALDANRTPMSLGMARVAAQSAAAKTLDRDRCRNLFARLKRNNTWVVPTLSVAYNANDPTRPVDQRLRYFEPETLSHWKVDPRRRIASNVGQVPPLSAIQDALGTVRELAAAGVELLAGSDTTNLMTFPGFDLHLELSLLVAAGLKPLEALQTATINPARFFGITGMQGTVAPGNVADLVVLDANPLADIRNSTKIRAVVVNGRLLDRSELDKLLTRVEAVARGGR
jgi:imidazolonepropionase-like amidohydrolase